MQSNAVQAVQLDKRYTYADLETWPGDERYELIDGVPYMMAAPSREHQKISGELFRQMANFLLGKPCEVYSAPFDVRLNAHDKDDRVVQPDIVVVCDHSKLNEKGCVGAPDLVVEILSPTTQGRDRVLKLNKYREAGVREYWIVDPEYKNVTVLVLTDDHYAVRPYDSDDCVASTVLDGFTVQLSEIFNY